MKKKIAVLACGWAQYFLYDFLQGVEKIAKENNADVYIFNCYDYVEFSGYPNATGFSIYRLINYEEYDGIIILSDLIKNPRVLEMERQRILKSGKPAVSINLKLKDISCMRIDNYTGFYELVTHLIKEHNARNLFYIDGNETSLDFTERRKAFRMALQDNQIELNRENIFTVEHSSFNYGYNAASEIFSSDRKLPDAIVCANDLIALGVLKAAAERNIKIPEQLKIAGYDGNYFARNVIPAISTVNDNAFKIGTESAKRVLTGFTEVQDFKIKSMPIYQGSCGCESKIITDQKLFSLKFLSEISQSENFAAQLNQIEEIFTDAADVFTLLTNLELFFSKSHTFEGSDFCIFLKADWASVLINSEENLPQNLSYGNQLQAITSIQNNVKYPREIIKTKDLIPSKMHSDECNTFLFIPIFNHSYVHGYFVCKNSLSMISNYHGHQWTRTFGACIERFRKKNMYKQMSQQFLRLSTRDALSGMLNRVGMEKLAKPFYQQNKHNGLTTVLFFVDINSMKTINDKFGHLHGDLAVKTIAQAVLQVVPRNWLCIRYGGDEFLVVGNSKNYNGEDYCKMITQMVLKKSSTMHLPYNLSASVGTLSVPANSPLSLEEAIEKVDEIMYEQKQMFHKTHH
ncbi:MAG: GGDEF domain-containing protein [Spirochaetia bacterium]|nr:GGDEF domain-containing protein [Spirochaetia bacterium]